SQVHRLPWWRGPLAAVALTMTAAHVPVTEDHFHEAPYIGALLVVLEVAGIVVAGALFMRREERRVYALAGVTGALAIAAYVVSRSIGLPQIHDDVGNWAEPLGIVSLVAESVLVVGGVVGWRGWFRASAVQVPRRVAAIGTAALLIAGLGVTVIANDA